MKFQDKLNLNLENIENILKGNQIFPIRDKDSVVFKLSSINLKISKTSGIIEIKPIAPFWITLISFPLAIFIAIILFKVIVDAYNTPNPSHQFTSQERLQLLIFILFIFIIPLRIVFEVIFQIYKVKLKVNDEIAKVAEIVRKGI